MWFPSSLPLLALAATSTVAVQGPPPPPPGVPQTDYDVIVVGGGPSGLSAASGLGRVRRSAYLIDSGVYRNAQTRHVHDVLGVDGVTPAYYRWLGRQKIEAYDTVTMTNGTVTRITPATQGPYSYFTVSADVPGQSVTLTARKVVVGTGLSDLIPPTPGLGDDWGKGIYWCPWCDGHEHANQPLGLLGPLEKVAGMVREIRTLNSDLVAFVNGTDVPANQDAAEQKMSRYAEYLALQNVTINNDTIAYIERLQDGGATSEDPSLATAPEHDLFRVVFADGSSVERAAFFTSFPETQTSTVGEDMGIQLVDGRLSANQTAGMQSNIDGAYAVGDANSDHSTNVPHALYSGKRAAVYLHMQVEKENADAELATVGVSSKKRDVMDIHSVWKRMNGEPGDLFYAGEFER